MKKRDDKYLYSQLVEQLEHVEEDRLKYDDLHRASLRIISGILGIREFPLHLEIIPPLEGEHEDYVHELQINLLQTPVTVTVDSLNRLSKFVGSRDMELHPHRDKLVITYTQELDYLSGDPVEYTEDVDGEDDVEQEEDLL